MPSNLQGDSMTVKISGHVSNFKVIVKKFFLLDKSGEEIGSSTGFSSIDELRAWAKYNTQAMPDHVVTEEYHGKGNDRTVVRNDFPYVA